MREIKLNEDGILHDGEETIPLRSEDVERVTTWFRDVSAFVKKCNVTVPEKKQEEEEETKEEEPKLKSSVRMLEDSIMEDVNQRCSFKDKDGNTYEFVSSRDGVLELYCNNILEYTSLSKVSLNEDNGVLDIEDDEFDILKQDIDRVSNFLRSNSSSLPFCGIQITKNDGDESFISSVAEESSESEDEEEMEEEEEEESILLPKSISESFQRIPRFCEFKDEEGTEISFTLNEVDGVTLEEWCDGELTIACVRVLKINEANCTIHDGEEEIPVPADDFPRVISWLRSVRAEANVTIEDIRAVDEEETKGESFMADEEKVDESVVEKVDESVVEVEKVDESVVVEKGEEESSEEEETRERKRRRKREREREREEQEEKGREEQKEETIDRNKELKSRTKETKEKNCEQYKLCRVIV